MSSYFFDSSAIAKRYLREIGTDWVRSLMLPTNIIVVSELAMVEVYSLLARRIREGSLSNVAAQQLRTSFTGDCASNYVVMPVDSRILSAAQHLVSVHVLRTLDAIHLASGLYSRQLMSNQSITLVTADRRLLSAAAAEGFATDDPNNHP